MRTTSTFFNRRHFLAGLAATAAAASMPVNKALASSHADDAGAFGISPNMSRDITPQLNRALEEAVQNGRPLFLRAGSYHVTSLVLPEGAQLVGAPGQTVIRVSGPGLMALGVSNVSLRHLTLESHFHDASDGEGLFHAMNARNLRLTDVSITGRHKNGIRLHRTSGVIEDCQISGAQFAAIHATDSYDLKLRDNRISDCGAQGIRISRTKGRDEDGTAITGNRINRIGYTGYEGGALSSALLVENANGCMVFNNRVEACNGRAIHVRHADHVQITSNQLRDVTETAILVNEGATGAVIAQNIIEDVGSGIAISQSEAQSRLVVVQGNLIRTLKESGREGRAFGITAEIDTTINANVIERAAHGTGIILGKGRNCRNLVATGNVLRETGRGIEVSIARGVEQAVIRANSFSGVQEAAIVGMAWQERVTEDLIRTGHQLHHIEGNVLV